MQANATVMQANATLALLHSNLHRGDVSPWLQGGDELPDHHASTDKVAKMRK
jgi:hypothetical protein